MAHMIPSTPKEFDEKSREGDIFRAFQKLSDDYYVFHSVNPVTVTPDGKYFERELDFVIANQEKGILCIEAKAGTNIQYENRAWYYGTGDKMDHDGPYHQVASAKRVLRDRIKHNRNDKIRALLPKMRLFHAVMFPDISYYDFERIPGLPEEADIGITLCSEDMLDPSEKVEEIFDNKLSWEDRSLTSTTGLDHDEFKLLLDGVLCPHFKMIPSPHTKDVEQTLRMNQLLHEQYRILDFLDEQETAVINGAAGTGKTMLAVEKARRHSMNGERVLFLCYNVMLRDKLEKDYRKSDDAAFREMFENVDFMTISRLAKKITGNHTDYDGLFEWLMKCADKTEELGYQHIIVDEGQDFGLIDKMMSTEEAGDASENCSIIDALQEAALAWNGTFYLFYDKYQMIQGGSSANYTLPDCIEHSDCRLTLHQNCRNTQEIARTSVTPLKDQKNRAVKPKTACSWETPVKPVMHIIEDKSDTTKTLNAIIDALVEQKIKDIVILTPGTMDYSAIAEHLEKDDFYRYRGLSIPVTTCIRFKGLEADAIILIDLDRNSFIGKSGNNFYVGSSRAKLRLELICTISESEYFDVVHELDPNAPHRKDAEKMRTVLANTFGVNIACE